MFPCCVYFPGNEETQSGAEGTGEGPQAADPPAPRTGGAGERPDGTARGRGLPPDCRFRAVSRFAADYARLVSGGCLTETPDGLGWHKSKQSLAEYFGRQEPADKKRRWRDIESLFGVTGLRNSLSRNRDMFKKTSND
jgi:hypothetical protein